MLGKIGFKKRCDCGEHKECVRKVYSDKNGKISVKTNEHFECGIIKKQITQSTELFRCYVRSKIGCHCIDKCENDSFNQPI